MIDIVGNKYNRLTVLSFDKSINYKTYWICECECGVIKSIYSANLKNGNTKSCGCYEIEQTSKRFFKHGNSAKNNEKCSTEYSSWQSIKNRCLNPTVINYNDYGGRGIIICDRWKNSFENFLQDMGNKPDKSYSIERIDVNGNYEPSNCKWATKIEQANNKRNNIIILDTITNKIYSSIAEASRDINMNFKTLWQQLKGRNPNKTNLIIMENEK